MEEYISRLKAINKDEMSEREFYEKVLTVLDSIDGEKRLSVEEHSALKAALLEIGCRRTEEWKQEKRDAGVMLPYFRGEGEGIDNGILESGVNMVSQLLSDHYTAVFGMSLMATSTKYSWMAKWVNNSKVKQRGVSPEEDIVTKLKDIDKSSMSEKEFYETVLTVLSDVQRIEMSEASFENIKGTLLDIGCKEIEDWNTEKAREGVVLENPTLGEGIKSGSLETGVNMVSQFLYDYDNLRFAIPMIFEGGEKSYVSQWINASKARDSKTTIMGRIQDKLNVRAGLKNRVQQKENENANKREEIVE